MISASLF